MGLDDEMEVELLIKDLKYRLLSKWRAGWEVRPIDEY